MPNPSEKVIIQKPYSLAMVVCDAIWRDPWTGKRTILGCFSTIGSRQFPANHPLMAVYVAVTDGRGKVPMTLQVVDVDEQHDPVFKAECEVDFTDPRLVLEMDFHMTGLAFPAPGEYRIQLLAGAEPVMERRLVVMNLAEERT